MQVLLQFKSSPPSSRRSFRSASSAGSWPLSPTSARWTSRRTSPARMLGRSTRLQLSGTLRSLARSTSQRQLTFPSSLRAGVSLVRLASSTRASTTTASCSTCSPAQSYPSSRGSSPSGTRRPGCSTSTSPSLSPGSSSFRRRRVSTSPRGSSSASSFVRRDALFLGIVCRAVELTSLTSSCRVPHASSAFQVVEQVQLHPVGRPRLGHHPLGARHLLHAAVAQGRLDLCVPRLPTLVLRRAPS